MGLRSESIRQDIWFALRTARRNPGFIMVAIGTLALGLDWRVLSFLVAASVATGIAFGILPALAASRISLQTVLKQAGEIYKDREDIRPEAIMEFKRPKETVVMDHVSQALEYEALLKKHRPSSSGSPQSCRHRPKKRNANGRQR